MTLPLRQRIAWVAWTVVLVASLSAVYALNERAEGRQVLPDDEGADTRYGFRLQESAKAMGVDFRHEAPTFDARLDHIMPQVAAMGASVTVADFDRAHAIRPELVYVVEARAQSLERLGDAARAQADRTALEKLRAEHDGCAVCLDPFRY